MLDLTKTSVPKPPDKERSPIIETKIPPMGTSPISVPHQFSSAPYSLVRGMKLKQQSII